MLTRSSARKSTAAQNAPRIRQPRKIIESNSDSDSEEENLSAKSSKLPRPPAKQKASAEGLDVGHVTPPKQKKIHNEDGVMTPSTLLNKLRLTSPIKNVTDSETQQSNKEVKSKNSQYQNARKALHSNFPTDMPGREKEIEEIKAFITNHVNNETSGSIYISGPPGTGKTASLNLIVDQHEVSADFGYVIMLILIHFQIASQVQKIYINCTAIKSATAVYSRLNKELHVKVNGKSEKDNLSAFEKFLKKKHKTM